MFIENLIRLGFTEKEAQVYLMLFRTGPAPASTLAQRVQMKRVSIYTILDTLCNKGVVSYEQTELGRRYIPHDPECIYEQLEQEKARLQFKLSLAKNCVEALHTPQVVRQINGQRVFYFKGEKSILRAVQTYIEPKKIVQHLVPAPTDDLKATECIRKYLAELKSNNTHWKAYTSNEYIKVFKKKFPDLQWALVATFSQSGHLFIQAERVFFLKTTKFDLELMLIIDNDYAKLLTQVIFESGARSQNPQEVLPLTQPALL